MEPECRPPIRKLLSYPGPTPPPLSSSHSVVLGLRTSTHILVGRHNSTSSQRFGLLCFHFLSNWLARDHSVSPHSQLRLPCLQLHHHRAFSPCIFFSFVRASISCPGTVTPGPQNFPVRPLTTGRPSGSGQPHGKAAWRERCPSSPQNSSHTSPGPRSRR